MTVDWVLLRRQSSIFKCKATTASDPGKNEDQYTFIWPIETARLMRNEDVKVEFICRWTIPAHFLEKQDCGVSEICVKGTLAFNNK